MWICLLSREDSQVSVLTLPNARMSLNMAELNYHTYRLLHPISFPPSNHINPFTPRPHARLPTNPTSPPTPISPALTQFSLPNLSNRPLTSSSCLPLLSLLVFSCGALKSHHWPKSSFPLVDSSAFLGHPPAICCSCFSSRYAADALLRVPPRSSFSLIRRKLVGTMTKVVQGAMEIVRVAAAM